MKFTGTCFSGECGFCVECSQRCFNKLEDPYTPEPLRRAEDLSKFLGKKRVDDIMMDYNVKLKSWCKENSYRNPEEPGRTKRILRLDRRGKDPVVFKLLMKSHGSVCDDPRCKVAYVSSSEWIHASTYPNLPIYDCESRGIQLCGPCISTKSSPPDISSL
jgi:hypothetical protein